MNNRIQRNYQELATALGLRLDAEGGALYGKRGGYDLIAYAENNSAYMFTVGLSAQRTSGPLTKEECKQFKRENKAVSKLSQNGPAIRMQMKNYSNQNKLQENMKASIDALASFLHMKGFVSCCQACAGENPVPCFVSGSYVNLCAECYQKIQHDSTLAQSQKKGKKENVIGGIVGALIGSLMGVASIVILSQMGYVAVLSGVIMAVCTLKGYEMLGGKLSKKGIVISSILMILMTLIGDHVDWAFVIMQQLEVDFITAYQILPLLLDEEAIDMSLYVGNLAMQYLFVLVGAIPTIIATVKNKKIQGQIYRLGNVRDSSDVEL